MLKEEDISLLTTPVFPASVKGFDEARGTGCLHREGHEEDIFFHCTQLTDGTRSIDVGRKVLAGIRPGKAGAPEACNIVKL